MGDIALRLDERPHGQFLGTTQPNPAAQLNAITTRSGRVLGSEVVKERVGVEGDKVVDEEIDIEAPGKSQGKTLIIEPKVEKKPVEFRPPPDIDLAYVPYPARLKASKLKIYLPFIEALQHMPKYAKFSKDLLKRKDRLGEVSSIPLSGDCSEVVLNRVPEKLSDPGVFTIPCMFESDMMSQALVDLGAIINLMPYSLYEKLELGIREEADERVPIILGRPLLRTAKALIYVYDGRITLRVGDENFTYDVAKSMKHPSDNDDFSGPCHSVYFLNSFILGLDTCLDYICGTDLGGTGVEKELTGIMEVNEEEVVDDVSCLVEIMEASTGGLSKISQKGTRPMTRLLEKDVPFGFNDECLKAFKFLKEQLVSAPIHVSPDWNLPFELMCDASDYAVGAVLGKRHEKHFHPIYYASKMLNDAKENCTTTEKKLLVIVFAFDKFRSYLVLSKNTVFIDHAALRFLFHKKHVKPHLI
ncbi:uncharacterized protein LOC143620611 [Bidens hawaiensis]|uniref:uncharacterized protein LOC143620611 n=1 Tax=Bidens hawaiensis TaxID=980011 RepID=UPI0040492E43